MSDRGFRYVLAYGSNLCLERMKRRCPSSRVVGTSDIPGYRLLFKKSLTGAYATIEQDANWTVPVVVYRISVSDELRLDRFEGCPTYQYGFDLSVLDEGLAASIGRKESESYIREYLSSEIT